MKIFETFSQFKIFSGSIGRVFAGSVALAQILYSAPFTYTLDANGKTIVENQGSGIDMVLSIEMAKIQKGHNDGNLLDGEYYSIDDLANHFGSFYELIPWVDNNHTLVTWGTSKNDEIPAAIDLLVSKGLTNLRLDSEDGIGATIGILPIVISLW